jgi:hypothetical protein
VRLWHLSAPAKAAAESLSPREREAVSAAINAMTDERVPLVGPEDRSVKHGSSIMGRAVPGTDLVICYIPTGPEFFVVNVRRLRDLR